MRDPTSGYLAEFTAHIRRRDVTLSVKKTEFERVIVDTTVHEKATAHPVDARLLEVSREKLVRLTKRAGIALKTTYDRKGKALHRRAAGYPHGKQLKRMRAVLRR